MKWSLERKFLVLGCILVTAIMLMVMVLYISYERDQTRQLIGQQALTTAIAVSEIPEVQHVIEHQKDADVLQPFIERIRKQSNAEFIVIGDRNSLRYTHPDPDKVGMQMVGGDNEQALVDGENYVSIANGSLGASVRGKSPIFNSDGDIIGIVSVGYMISYVDSLFKQGLIGFLVWLSLIFIIGVAGSFLLAKSIRKDTFGLEPYQIARIYKERGAILESIKEGLIATDQRGHITLVNYSAKEMLHIRHDVIGKPVQEVLPNTELAYVLTEEHREGSFETTINQTVLLVRYKLIDDDGDYGGKVASFQVRSDLQELIHTLSEVQQYSQDLRAQTHEYTNKLYVISGWLQLGHTDKAKQFIHEEVGKQQSYEKVLFEQISDSTIQAILIGKLSKASEKKIEFTINEGSHINYQWPEQMTAQLVTIIGNIIDNAFDAVVNTDNPKIDIFLTDMGNDLVIEVADNGTGISPADYDNIMKQGYSTKDGQNRGYGLALVQAALLELQGFLEITANEPNGTVFIVYIPKKGGAES
ncbi:two-component sensor histidine kinase [Oceanobacillus iheyensis HTE831]|uniref:histidine kinase n=1 Tax=Oceanobacillus iheyensis (strain DSM 14371 / CIP 107618 / JCM 11309 / KCTC 3954 / HTE831) TaxID=221109 RepID=Q8ELH6_OCEIH|nr:sensor histidine kinase [Oceanobacillus iheyensis]BAC15207.1 two-component sensor histidine kinase [Oceanobacillus iheyensis HTE831]